MPRVSVIIPAHNAASTVKMALESVLHQTLADVEVLVVDDGSDDTTATIVSECHDARIRLLRTENRGVAAARNRGLDRASSDLVAFLDADDAWRPTKLERQVELMTTRPTLGLCFTAAAVVDEQLRPVRVDAAPGCQSYAKSLLLNGNVIPGGGSSVLAQRALLHRIGAFDPNLSQCADWDLWLRLSVVTDFGSIRDPLTIYRRGSNTMSSNPGLLERDTFALLDKFYASSSAAPFRCVRRQAYANHWMICAGTYLHAGRIADAARCARRGVRSNPRTVRRPLMLPARWIRRRARKPSQPYLDDAGRAAHEP